MHREFLELLEKATGRSEYVIAINLDIRGFTPFCKSVESFDVAMYIKKIYLKIINDYFKNATYYKPTGDGLIIIIPCIGEKLSEIVNSTVESCLDLLEKFGSLCIDEPMINYPIPQKIGIGLARGSVCCIISEEDKILDYSGRILNLASRLMDIARPSGIVFDESFGIDLLKDKTKELFSEETVYVRGVAEQEPIKIHYTKRHTLIPDSYKQPLKEPKWNIDTENYSLAELHACRTKTLFIELSKKPMNENKITVKLTHPNPLAQGYLVWHDFSIDDHRIKYGREGNTYNVGFDVDAIIELLEKGKVPKDMNLRMDVIYPVK